MASFLSCNRVSIIIIFFVSLTSLNTFSLSSSRFLPPNCQILALISFRQNANFSISLHKHYKTVNLYILLLRTYLSVFTQANSCNPPYPLRGVYLNLFALGLFALCPPLPRSMMVFELIFVGRIRFDLPSSSYGVYFELSYTGIIHVFN